MRKLLIAVIAVAIVLMFVTPALGQLGTNANVPMGKNIPSSANAANAANAGGMSKGAAMPPSKAGGTAAGAPSGGAPSTGAGGGTY